MTQDFRPPSLSVIPNEFPRKQPYIEKINFSHLLFESKQQAKQYVVDYTRLYLPKSCDITALYGSRFIGGKRKYYVNGAIRCKVSK
jgi:hypothetical protein